MNEDIIAEYYRRAKAGMDVGKRRAGIFHVSDYARPCARESYLRHTSVPQLKGRFDNRRALIKGEAEHQLLDRGAKALYTAGETALAWDLHRDRPVPYNPEDPPATEDMDMLAWLEHVFGEYDAIYHFKDGKKILVDYKTKLEFNPKQKEADADHRDQLSIYNYMRSRILGTEPLTKGCILYIVSGTNDPTHVYPYVFDLEDITEVRDRMQERLKAFLECNDTGKMPDRVLPIGYFPGGYGHYSCSNCPYRDRCLVKRRGNTYGPSDWDTLNEFERELNIL